MQFPPKAYLIGAQKAGTTTLASLLDQHPSICLSNPKEPNFFSHNFDKGLDWYRQCFKPAGDAILLDASPSYSLARIGPDGGASGQVAQRIHQHRPDARLIYLLRDPVERAYSGYSHAARTGFESKPFKEAIAENPSYLAGSCYFAQAQPYLKLFGREAVLFLSFHQLSRDPVSVARIVLDFLQIPDRNFCFVDDGPKNQGFQYNSFGTRLRQFLGSEGRTAQLGLLVRSVTPEFAHPYIKRLISKEGEQMSNADRALLNGYFAEENARIRELAGISFD